MNTRNTLVKIGLVAVTAAVTVSLAGTATAVAEPKGDDKSQVVIEVPTSSSGETGKSYLSLPGGIYTVGTATPKANATGPAKRDENAAGYNGAQDMYDDWVRDTLPSIGPDFPSGTAKNLVSLAADFGVHHSDVPELDDLEGSEEVRGELSGVLADHYENGTKDRRKKAYKALMRYQDKVRATTVRRINDITPQVIGKIDSATGKTSGGLSKDDVKQYEKKVAAFRVPKSVKTRTDDEGKLFLAQDRPTTVGDALQWLQAVESAKDQGMIAQRDGFGQQKDD